MKTESVLKWRASNPSKVKDMILRRKYGITVADFDAMILSQGNKCAICGDGPNGNPMHFPHIDHCHTTNKVRGLLCRKCNHAVGLLKDDPKIFLAGAAYLQRT